LFAYYLRSLTKVKKFINFNYIYLIYNQILIKISKLLNFQKLKEINKEKHQYFGIEKMLRNI